MTTPSKPKPDKTYSSFAIGVSVGVVAGILFGTEEGRKIVKQAINSIPEKYRRLPIINDPSSPNNHFQQDHQSPLSDSPSRFALPIIPQEETPHHVTFNSPPPQMPRHATIADEAPPPPPPSTTSFRPEYLSPSSR